jgi:hypothetical protein
MPGIVVEAFNSISYKFPCSPVIEVTLTQVRTFKLNDRGEQGISWMTSCAYYYLRHYITSGSDSSGEVRLQTTGRRLLQVQL